MPHIMTNAIQNGNLKVKYVAMAIIVLCGMDCMGHGNIYISLHQSICFASDLTCTTLGRILFYNLHHRFISDMSNVLYKIENQCRSTILKELCSLGLLINLKVAL